MMFNQKGLTLIEVLVSILILAGGSIYVLQALSRSAEVQRRMEDQNSLFPMVASKLAELEMRVPLKKNPFKESKGTFMDGASRYEWTVSSSFRNPLEKDAAPEALGTSILLDRSVSVGWSDKKEWNGMQLSTLFKAAVADKKS